MFSKMTMILAAAIALGVASPATAAHRSVHSYGVPAYAYGSGISRAPDAHHVLPFTEEERSMFDRASRPSPF
jgi:hypothetical protein